jgi:hypothetical protein
MFAEGPLRETLDGWAIGRNWKIQFARQSQSFDLNIEIR